MRSESSRASGWLVIRPSLDVHMGKFRSACASQATGFVCNTPCSPTAEDYLDVTIWSIVSSVSSLDIRAPAM